MATSKERRIDHLHRKNFIVYSPDIRTICEQPS